MLVFYLFIDMIVLYIYDVYFMIIVLYYTVCTSIDFLCKHELNSNLLFNDKILYHLS